MTREEAIERLKWVDPHNLEEKDLEAIRIAIEALQREEAEEKGYCHRIKPKEYFKNNAMQKLREMPRYLNGVKEKQIKKISADAEWIPCSERLPEEGERVLATHLGGVNPNRQVIEHIYQCGEFTCGWDMDMNVGSPTFGQRYMGKVIAWMPLPEPYREENEE